MFSTRHLHRAARCFARVILSLALLQSSPAGAGDNETVASAERKLDDRWTKLEAHVAAIERGIDGVAGIVIQEIGGHRRIMHNPDEIFPSASIIKVPILAELYRQAREPGSRARLGDPYTVRTEDLVEGSDIMSGLTPGVTRVTNGDLATFMIVVSDNSATNVLIDRIGVEPINALLEHAGLKHTRLRRKMMDVAAALAGRENTTTPREIATLLESIHAGKVLNAEMTGAFMRTLGTHKESYIPRYLPEEVTVANKPGVLEGFRGDAGIVLVPNRPFVISVMVSYASDGSAAEEAIAQIAEAAYHFFDVASRASEYGRLLPAPEGASK